LAKRASDPEEAAVERIIRPIVEGQIRGFLLEHPSVLQGVDWFRQKGRDPAATFIGSLSKRITRDLISGTSRRRLAAALLEAGPDAPPSSDHGTTSGGRARSGITGLDRASPPPTRSWKQADSAPPSRDGTC